MLGKKGLGSLLHKPGWCLMALVLALTLTLGACSTASAPDAPGTGEKPPLPDKIKEFVGEIPLINVYVVSKGASEKMSLEEYLQGVLAGEMRNDWPLEALKAQAILARTYTLHFMTTKESKHGGADISTDIEEAQAYDPEGINDRIKQAVKETEGMVLVSNGEFPNTWFHAHAGGITALAKEGLAYEQDEPPYTQVVQSPDSDQAPEDAKAWTATFSGEQVMKAAGQSGTLESFEIAETGESGRAVTFNVNGKSVSAPAFRIAIGSTEMRSTLLTEAKVEGGKLTLAGKGYGHGVGMSQWGAYGMAEDGATAEEIVTHYFKDVTVEKMW